MCVHTLPKCYYFTESIRMSLLIWRTIGAVQLVVSLANGFQTNSTKGSEFSAFKQLTDLNSDGKSDDFLLYNDPGHDTAADDIQLSLWDGINIKKEAAKIREHLRELANDELGVTVIQVNSLYYQ